jgi:prepilin-type N-terminal cleavage/methylation domain-containing protein
MLLSLPRQRALHANHANQGMTLIEVMVSVFVLTLCTWMLSTTLMASAHHAETKRERALAVASAANLLEHMHAIPFEQLFARFNENPLDDPKGPQTAPGAHFAVDGLSALASDTDGFVGRVYIPAVDNDLREDTLDEMLGLPRDLNGDLFIDADDHSHDYIVLPVVIKVEWQGMSGRRTFSLETVLSGIRRHDQ